MSKHHHEVRNLGRARQRVAAILTTLIVLSYFGFMLLVPTEKEWLGTQIVPGFSWGILLGIGMILFSWLLIFVYVQWTNRVLDPAMDRIKEQSK